MPIITSKDDLRFYAIGTGQEKVTVKSIYLTKLDRVTCAAPYTRITSSIYTTMTYEACDVAPCDPECTGGCNLPNDPTQCLACKNAQMFFSKARFECTPTCGNGFTEISGVKTGMYNDTINIQSDTPINQWGGTVGVQRPAFIALEGDGFTQAKGCKLS